MIIAAIIVYALAAVLTILYGGLNISEISVLPIAFLAGTIWMIFVWQWDEAPDSTNLYNLTDAPITFGEKRTMFLECAKILKLSTPLQLLLIFTWNDIAKGFFSFFVFFIAIIVGFHLGRRKIRKAVYDRMDEQKKNISN